MPYRVASRRVMGRGAYKMWAPSGAVPAPPSVFVNDTFSTGAAGVELSTRQGEAGATWTIHGSSGTGRLLVSDEARVYAGTATGAHLYYASGVPDDADYRVEADLVVKSAAVTGLTAGLSARVATGADTHYNFRYQRSSAAWILGKWVAGTPTNFDIVAVTLAAQTYHLELRVTGALIQGFVDGVEVASETDPSPITDAGRAGLRGGGALASNTTGYHWDNYVATN